MTERTRVEWELGEVATVHLVSPAGKPPLLDFAGIAQLSITLDRLEKSVEKERCRVLVIKSKSPKFFCCGGDIRVLEKIDPQSFAAWVLMGHQLMDKIAALEIPTIAVVDGYALGGGLELALAFDFILGGENSHFGLTEHRVGMIPGWGGHGRLSRRIGISRAKELVFTSRMIDGVTAERWGLINHCYPSADLEREALKIVEDICANVSVSTGSSKEIFRELEADNMAYQEAVKSMKLIEAPDVQSALKGFTRSNTNPRK